MKLTTYLNEAARKSPIAYHGTYSDIKKFSTRRKISETGVRHFGSYFSDSIDVARSFGKHVYKVQLKFNKIIDMTKWKPFDADEKFVLSLPELRSNEKEEYLKFEYRGKNSPYNVLETLDGKYDILKRWKKRGYDGIAFWESHFGGKGITYVPFYPNQIKIIEVI